MPVPIPIAQAQVQETAKSVANKALNGAQTLSLIMVIQQYQSKALTLQQAVNIIALSIGISKDDAKELIGKTMLQSGGEDDKTALQKDKSNDILSSTDILEELRAQARDKNGRFAGGGGKTKYAPSAQRNKTGIQVSPEKYSKLCGIFNTKYPNASKSDGATTFLDAKYRYKATPDGYGGIIIYNRAKIK